MTSQGYRSDVIGPVKNPKSQLTRFLHFFAELCTNIIRQPDKLESCSNPLKMGQV